MEVFDFEVFANPQPRTDRHKLSGRITVDGLPAKRAVLAVDRLTLQIRRVVYSNPDTGEWVISGIPEYPERSLLVLSIDNTGNYNAEVADYVSQVQAIPQPE